MDNLISLLYCGSKEPDGLPSHELISQLGIGRFPRAAAVENDTQLFKLSKEEPVAIHIDFEKTNDDEDSCDLMSHIKVEVESTLEVKKEDDQSHPRSDCKTCSNCAMVGPF